MTAWFSSLFIEQKLKQHVWLCAVLVAYSLVIKQYNFRSNKQVIFIHFNSHTLEQVSIT